MKLKKRNFIRIAVALILTLSVAFAVSYLGFRNDLAAGRAKLADLHSRIFESKYGDVEYVLTGTGPTIVISHGVTGGVDQGIGLAETYVGKGYRFLHVSRFGYLRSSMPAEPSVKLQAEVFDNLLSFLRINRAFILGNSAGGPSAIHFAIDYPEKCSGLILVSSAVPGNTNPLPPKAFMNLVFASDYLYWCAVKLFAANMIKMFVPKPILKTLPPAERKRWVDTVLLSGLPISRRTAGVLFDTYRSNPSMDEALPFEKITSPTLILHAVDDPAPPIAGARLLAKRIPHCELVVLATGGHLLLNHESEIKETINRFVSSHREK